MPTCFSIEANPSNVTTFFPILVSTINVLNCTTKNSSSLSFKPSSANQFIFPFSKPQDRFLSKETAIHLKVWKWCAWQDTNFTAPREKKSSLRERERERFDGLGWRGQGFANSYWTWVKDSIPSIGLDKT